MLLTTKERVVKFDNALPDLRDGTVLDMIIAGVSGKVKDYLGREILIAQYEEYFPVAQFSDGSYRTTAFPITRVDPLPSGDPNPLKLYNYDEEIPREFWELDYKTGYFRLTKESTLVDPFNGVSSVFLAGGVFYLKTGTEALRLVYHGGMALDTADFISKYPGIEYEIMLQVIFEYKRKKSMTQVSVGAGGNNSEEYVPFELRKELKRALRPYRRVTGVA